MPDSNMPGEAMSDKWGVKLSRPEDCLGLCTETQGCETAVYWTRARPLIGLCWLYTAPFTRMNTPSTSANRKPIQVLYCSDVAPEVPRARPSCL